MDIKFIKYTGKYPNLCTGILTLEIDGCQYNFGSKIISDGTRSKAEGEQFWYTTGCITKDNNGFYYSNKGEWNVSKNLLPIWLENHAEEIKEVINDNVPWGCCGGCI